MIAFRLLQLLPFKKFEWTTTQQQPRDWLSFKCLYKLSTITQIEEIVAPGCVVVECASSLVYVRSAVSVKLLPFVNPPPPSSSCCSRADVSLNEQMSDWSSLLHYCWNEFSCVVKCSRDEKNRAVLVSWLKKFFSKTLLMMILMQKMSNYT